MTLGKLLIRGQKMNCITYLCEESVTMFSMPLGGIESVLNKNFKVKCSLRRNFWMGTIARILAIEPILIIGQNHYIDDME